MTDQQSTLDVVHAYFSAFNAGDGAAMAALVTEDVAHHVNQGEVRLGREKFNDFLAEMDRAYREEARDLVVFATPDGARAAAEFTIHGTYLATQDGLPEATGQSYTLPVGSFFTLRDGLIARVTTYYNLQDWMAQVGIGA